MPKDDGDAVDAAAAEARKRVGCYSFMMSVGKKGNEKLSEV